MAFERAIAVPTTFFGAYTPRERPSKPPPRAHAARDDSPLTPLPMSIRAPRHTRERAGERRTAGRGPGGDPRLQTFLSLWIAAAEPP